jgi:chlorite dismutase
MEMSMEVGSEEEKRFFFNFSFFKVDPKWRWMADLAKEESAKEVENVISHSGIKVRTYSTLGLRDDAELLFWFASESIEEIQSVISKLYLTVFGKYITPSHVYLSCTRPSIYAKTGRIPSFVSGDEPKQYVIIYPFIKTREWYLLPVHERQKMMEEHIEVGRGYPQVILNTTYSFGIHDQDFMLAFETDDLHAFQNLIMDLRGTKVSRYVAVDTPMIVCVKKDIIPLISSLG